MTKKLPVLSGDQLIKIVEQLGYLCVRQKGSHVRLRHATDPLHKTLKRGLLHRLLRDAEITEDQFSALLKETF